MQFNTDARRAMLTARRIRQRAAVRGFTPMPNKRINQAIQLKAADLIARELALGNTPVIQDIQQEAVKAVAATLGGGRLVRSYAPKPSKNDSPEYRGIGGVGRVRQAALGL